MNLPIVPVISLVPVKKIKLVVSDLNPSTLEILLKQLGSLASDKSQGINWKQCMWLDAVISQHPDMEIEADLRSAIENLLQQVSLLGAIKDKLSASQLLALA